MEIHYPPLHVFSISLKMRLSRDAQRWSQTLRLKKPAAGERVTNIPPFAPTDAFIECTIELVCPCIEAVLFVCSDHFVVFFLFIKRVLLTLCTKRSVILRRVRVPVSFCTSRFTHFANCTVCLGSPAMYIFVHRYWYLFVSKKLRKQNGW